MTLNDFVTGLLFGWFLFAFALFWYWVGHKWWHIRKYGPEIDHGLLLVSFGRLLSGAVDQEELSHLLTGELAAELGVKQSLLLLPDNYQLVSTNHNGMNLPINHAAVRWISSSGEAQFSYKGRLKELIEQGRTDLSWTRVWVPLMRGTQLKGMWMLGERESGLHFSPKDLQCLTSISREAAAVLEAIRYAEQERQISFEMRSLYRQMIAAREAERGRLSRELHDGVLQDLCAVTRDLKAIMAKTDVEDDALDYLVNLAGNTVLALRTICNDLRPPLLLQDLASALKTLVEDMDNRSAAPVHIEISASTYELQMTDDMALAIFRITQEALNNAVQYADASEIVVRLTRYPDRLRLTITDDGQGIQGNLESANFIAGGHYGIAGMRERAGMIGGKLDIQTSSGYGTVVILEAPAASAATGKYHRPET